VSENLLPFLLLQVI